MTSPGTGWLLPLGLLLREFAPLRGGGGRGPGGRETREAPGSGLSLSVRIPADAAGALGASEFRMTPREKTADLGQRVELHCEVLLSTSGSGCSWLFLEPGAARSPTFLMFISKVRGKPVPAPDSSRFSGAKVGNDRYSLTLNSFRKEDEGYYFCSVLSNSILYFSPFVPVFLPGPGAARGGVGTCLRTRFSQGRAPLSSLLAPLGGSLDPVPISHTGKLRLTGSRVGTEDSFLGPGRSGFEFRCPYGPGHGTLSLRFLVSGAWVPTRAHEAARPGGAEPGERQIEGSELLRPSLGRRRHLRGTRGAAGAARAEGPARGLHRDARTAACGSRGGAGRGDPQGRSARSGRGFPCRAPPGPSPALSLPQPSPPPRPRRDPPRGRRPPTRRGRCPRARRPAGRQRAPQVRRRGVPGRGGDGPGRRGRTETSPGGGGWGGGTPARS